MLRVKDHVAGGHAAASGDDDDGPAVDDPRTDDEWAADEAAAATMVLTLSDFPPGWESTQPDETETDDRFDEQLAECVGIDVADLDRDYPKSESPDFEASNGDVVSSLVAFAPTAEDAASAIAVRSQEGATECFAEGIQAVLEDSLANPDEGEDLPEDFRIGDATVNEMSFEALGDETLAFRVTVPFELANLETEMYLDFVNVRVGRVGVTMGFQSMMTPFDIDEAVRLTRIVVDRVEAGR